MNAEIKTQGNNYELYNNGIPNISNLYVLEGTACYSGLLLAPAEGFSLHPRFFLLFRQQKVLFMFGLFLAFLDLLVDYYKNLKKKLHKKCYPPSF